jgi:hypothetical protein
MAHIYTSRRLEEAAFSAKKANARPTPTLANFTAGISP